jgi:hypothetical protein
VKLAPPALSEIALIIIGVFVVLAYFHGWG